MLREIKNREVRMMAVHPGKSPSSLRAQRRGGEDLKDGGDSGRDPKEL